MEKSTHLFVFSAQQKISVHEKFQKPKPKRIYFISFAVKYENKFGKFNMP